jgi:hypothetical protein
MRTRRFRGVLERRLLGAAMSAILFVVERRLSKRNRDAAHAGASAGERRVP